MTEKKSLEVLNSWLRVAYQNADGTDEASAELYEALQTVFALITRQQAEIERLKKENDALNGNTEKYIRQCEQRSQQIAEDYRAEILFEACNKFAERLKAAAYTYSDICGYQSTVVDVSEIDGVLEEMVSENKCEILA